MSNFSKLGLSPSVLSVLEKLGFENPTPIQEKSIPLILENNPTDFIGLAQTGTGKTAAFGLPLVDLIDTDSDATQALIMAPTRELGQQTATQLKSFAQNNRNLNVEVVYGGAAIVNQIRALRRPTQIVVATPGRLLDLIKRKAVRLDQVSHVVLDEADEMLNMGFKEDIDEILSHTPESRVTWLFSATMPAEIRRIVKKYMDAPLEVSIITEHKTNTDIAHKFVVTKTSDKIPALKRFLDMQPDMRGIMFCRTRRETREIAEEMMQMGYNVEPLHGELSQAQRDAVMRRFKNRSMQLLVATDVAARGIDVNDLSHVIHHTLPEQLESYTHRSGRTGRAGRKGISLVFINPREARKIEMLERKIKVKFERIEVPKMKDLKAIRLKNWAEKMVASDVSPESEAMLAEMRETFAELSKEDILQRLISEQLAQLTQKGSDGDLNADSSRGGNERRGRAEESNFRRYFINIGSIDGITKSELVTFLADISNVDQKYIGDLSLQKNCTYFDVAKSHDQGFGNRFDGVEIEGRAIRVNRDMAGPARSGGGKGDFWKKKNGRPGGGKPYGKGAPKKGKGHFHKAGNKRRDY